MRIEESAIIRLFVLSLSVLLLIPVLSFCQTETQFTEISPFIRAVHGMALDENGVLYFADSYKKVDGTSRVYRLPPPYTGQPEALEITGNVVAGLLWHQDHLFVCVIEDNQVRKYDRELNLAQTWEIPLPWNITSDGDSLYVVTYGGDVFRIVGDDTVALLHGLEYPFDIVYDGQDGFWISEQVSGEDPGRITRIDKSGTIVERIGQGFKNPEGLALDKDGNLIIADTVAGKIFRLIDGDLQLVTDEYSIPICVDAGPDGTIFINCNHGEGMLLVLPSGE